MERPSQEKQNFGSDVEWTSSFNELGVNAKFLSFWNRATAYNFKIEPIIFINVWPVEPEKQAKLGFMQSLAEEIIGEISRKILIKDGKPQYELKLGVDIYDEDSMVLSLVATRDFKIPSGINELPL